MHSGNFALLNASDKYKDNQSNTGVTIFFFFNIINTKALIKPSILKMGKNIFLSIKNEFHP